MCDSSMPPVESLVFVPQQGWRDGRLSQRHFRRDPGALRRKGMEKARGGLSAPVDQNGLWIKDVKTRSKRDLDGRNHENLMSARSIRQDRSAPMPTDIMTTPTICARGKTSFSVTHLTSGPREATVYCSLAGSTNIQHRDTRTAHSRARQHSKP